MTPTTFRAIRKLSADGEPCDHHGTLASHGQAELIATILGALPRYPGSRAFFHVLLQASQLYCVFGERGRWSIKNTVHCYPAAPGFRGQGPSLRQPLPEHLHADSRQCIMQGACQWEAGGPAWWTDMCLASRQEPQKPLDR